MLFPDFIFIPLESLTIDAHGIVLKCIISRYMYNIKISILKKKST